MRFPYDILAIAFLVASIIVGKQPGSRNRRHANRIKADEVS